MKVIESAHSREVEQARTRNRVLDAVGLTVLAAIIDFVLFVASSGILVPFFHAVAIAWLGRRVLRLTWAITVMGWLFSLAMPIIILLIAYGILSFFGAYSDRNTVGSEMQFSLLIWAGVSAVWWYVVDLFRSGSRNDKIFLRSMMVFALISIIFLFWLRFAFQARE